MNKHYFYLIAIILFTYIQVEFFDNVFAAFFLPIFSVLLLLCIVLILVIAILLKKKVKRYLIITIKYILAIAISFALSLFIQKLQQDNSNNKGMQIVSAIDQFLKEKGQYPKKMEDLRPNYLNQIPNSSMGVFRNIKYHFYFQHSKYNISYRCSILGGRQVYRTEYSEWMYDD